MKSLVPWIARAALLVVLGIAFAGAIDPHHNAQRSVPPADVIEHVAYGYLLTVLTIASLPRVNPWWIGAAYLAGLAVEYWHGLNDVSSNWALDREFQPQLGEPERQRRLARWKKAVTRSLEWEEKD